MAYKIIAALNSGSNNNLGTHLDSHANMVVLGKHCRIISQSGTTAQVSEFTDDIGCLQAVPIVDAAISYDCPNTGRVYVLIARNALYVPSMDHNLIPPFIMREAQLTVNEVPKIHCLHPDNETHCIID